METQIDVAIAQRPVYGVGILFFLKLCTIHFVGNCTVFENKLIFFIIIR